MSAPFGAIVNSAVSLTKAVASPSASNVVAAASSAAATLTGSPSTVSTVVNGAKLVGSAASLLSGGSTFSPVNAVNSAVKLAQGFLDPKTAATVGAISGGLNQLLGAGGILSGLGFSPLLGKKPIALHTDSMPAQDMISAYAESKDVVFSFVRADSGTAAESFIPPEALPPEEISFEDALNAGAKLDFGNPTATNFSSFSGDAAPVGDFSSTATASIA